MFRTELPFAPHPQQLPQTARLLTVGSCFSDVVGKRLATDKVSTLVNPFGTVFNPVSACRLLRAAAGEDMDWQQHLVEARGRWQSFDLHASIGAESPVVLLQHIQALMQRTGEFLRTADVVVLTLGSAFSYRLHETQELVSNCHKVPAERFTKELLTPDEIVAAVAETHAFLRRHNPTLRFILTVSPVRHLKDTLPLNAVSKSALRVACHYLSELLPDVSYFPAYELLLDDLRDYRFYAADMLHPSEVAENYVWERFARTYFDAGFGRFRKEWESVRQALGHRPLHPAAPEHRQFLENTLERLQRLATQADLQPELEQIRQQLAALPPVPVAAPEPVEDDEEEYFEEEEVAPAPAPTEAAPEAQTEGPVVPAAELPTATEEQPLPKKKRRSRGGAKRTARKKAAQLAAAQEAAASEPMEISDSPEPVEAPEEMPLPTPGAEELQAAPVTAVATEEATTTEPSTTLLGEPEDTSMLPAPAAEPEAAPAAFPAEVAATDTEPEPVAAPALAAAESGEEAEPVAPAPKPRKGRTAGQILKDKTGRKSPKTTSKTQPEPKAAATTTRPTRRKAAAVKPEPVAAAPEEAAVVAVPPPLPELPPVEPVVVPTPAVEPEPEAAPPPAPKRKSRAPRKKPTAPDEPAPEV